MPIKKGTRFVVEYSSPSYDVSVNGTRTKVFFCIVQRRPSRCFQCAVSGPPAFIENTTRMQSEARLTFRVDARYRCADSLRGDQTVA
jgi:hypothetical protein